MRSKVKFTRVISIYRARGVRRSKSSQYQSGGKRGEGEEEEEKEEGERVEGEERETPIDNNNNGK